MKKIIILLIILFLLLNFNIRAKGKRGNLSNYYNGTVEAYESKSKNLYICLLVILLFSGYLIPSLLSYFFLKEPQVNFNTKYEINPPIKLPPAWIELLLKKHGKVSERAYSSTFIDLAFNEYIIVKEENKDYKIIMTDKEMDDNLSDDQKILLFLLRRIGKEFNLSDISKLNLKGFKQAFNRAVKENIYEKLKWINSRSKKYFLLNICLWIFALFISLVFFDLGIIIVSAHNLIFGLIFIPKCSIYTYEGKLMRFKWRAYKRYLKDKLEDLIKNNDNMTKIKDLIIFGILFGFHRKILKKLEEENILKEIFSKWFLTRQEKTNKLLKSLNIFISELNKVFRM